MFQWVLGVLAKRRLVKGNIVGVDATTLEANAAFKSIVKLWESNMGTIQGWTAAINRFQIQAGERIQAALSRS